MVDEPINDSPDVTIWRIREEIRHGHARLALGITASLVIVATVLPVGLVGISGERSHSTDWITDLIVGNLLAFAILVSAIALIVVLTNAVRSLSTRRIAEI